MIAKVELERSEQESERDRALVSGDNKKSNNNNNNSL